MRGLRVNTRPGDCVQKKSGTAERRGGAEVWPGFGIGPPNRGERSLKSDSLSGPKVARVHKSGGKCVNFRESVIWEG